MIISVRVKPNSRNNLVQCLEDGTYVVNVTSSPVDGKANEKLLELLATHFHKPKSSIRIKRGASSRNKLIVVE